MLSYAEDEPQKSQNPDSNYNYSQQDVPKIDNYEVDSELEQLLTAERKAQEEEETQHRPTSKRQRTEGPDLGLKPLFSGDAEKEKPVSEADSESSQIHEKDNTQPHVGQYIPRKPGLGLAPSQKKEHMEYNYFWQYKKKQEQAIVTNSQETIMKFFMQFPNEFPKTWHYEMRRWRQSMAGFLIGYFKNTANVPVSFKDLLKLVSPYILSMKKSDGKYGYQGNITKIIQATLFLNRLFIRDGKNRWMMDTLRAKAYEIKNLGEEYITGFDDCRVPTQEEINAHYQYITGAVHTESQQAQHLQNLNLQMTQDNKRLDADVKAYRRRRDLLDKFEIIYQKTSHKLDFIWEKVMQGDNQNERQKEMWNNLSNEKMIGILHAFVLLKSTIEKTMQNCNKIENAMKFMHQHGFQTHSKRSIAPESGRFITNNNLPILTRDDANHILAIDYKTLCVNSRLSSVFDTLQVGLESLGHKMPPIPQSATFYQYSEEMKSKYHRLDKEKEKRKQKASKKHRDVSQVTEYKLVCFKHLRLKWENLKRIKQQILDHPQEFHRENLSILQRKKSWRTVRLKK